MDVSRYQEAWADEMPHWISLLMLRAAAIGVRKTAKELEVSHALVSQVLLRKLPGPTLHQRVLAQWGAIECVAYEDRISIDRCEMRRKTPCPTHNPMAMQRWRTCLQCPHNPQSKEAKHADQQ